jgi:hypothetical protein
MRSSTSARASYPLCTQRPAFEDASKRVEWKPPEALKVGAKVAFEVQFMGRKVEYIYEIKEHVPGESLLMSTAAGPFPMETSYKFSDTPSGATKVELRNRGPPVRFWERRCSRDGRCN